MSTTDLAKIGTNGQGNWIVMREQAQVFIKSGFLPQAIKTPEQALTIMITGQELGVPAMQALRGINVIQGTPVVKPELMLALCVQRIPGFKYGFKNCDNQSATFWAQRPEMPEPHEDTFTMEDAKAAQLAGKDNWKKWPGNMLRWRVVGNVLHVVAPDVLVGIYTPDELGAVTNEEGVIVEGVVINTEGRSVDTTTGEIAQPVNGNGKLSEAQYDFITNLCKRKDMKPTDPQKVAIAESIPAMMEGMKVTYADTTVTKEAARAIIEALNALDDKRGKKAPEQAETLPIADASAEPPVDPDFDPFADE